jgi:hypothetical protein
MIWCRHEESNPSNQLGRLEFPLLKSESQLGTKEFQEQKKKKLKCGKDIPKEND